MLIDQKLHECVWCKPLIVDSSVKLQLKDEYIFCNTLLEDDNNYYLSEKFCFFKDTKKLRIVEHQKGLMFNQLSWLKFPWMAENLNINFTKQLSFSLFRNLPLFVLDPNKMKSLKFLGSNSKKKCSIF